MDEIKTPVTIEELIQRINQLTPVVMSWDDVQTLAYATINSQVTSTLSVARFNEFYNAIADGREMKIIQEGSQVACQGAWHWIEGNVKYFGFHVISFFPGLQSISMNFRLQNNKVYAESRDVLTLETT